MEELQLFWIALECSVIAGHPQQWVIQCICRSQSLPFLKDIVASTQPFAKAKAVQVSFVPSSASGERLSFGHLPLLKTLCSANLL